MIIDKNSNAESVIKNCPIRWTIDRVSGLYYIIDRCKKTGAVLELTPKGNNYELKVIKGENE